MAHFKKKREVKPSKHRAATNKVAQVIEGYLFLARMPKKELSERLGIHLSTLYRWLDGTYDPPLSVAIKLHVITEGKITFQQMIIKGDALYTATSRKITKGELK